MKTPPSFRFRFESSPPVTRIESGGRLDLVLPDSDGLGPDMKLLPRRNFGLERNASFPGNPCYGPILIENAKPGDALEVRILKAAPNRACARTFHAHGHGFINEKYFSGAMRDGAGYRRQKPRMYLWKLGPSHATLENGFGKKKVRIPVRPFLGCVGTASPESPSTLVAGTHGGNLDLPFLGEGCSLFLPVTMPGALLFVGDMHAAQGDGEFMGGGLEVSGKVRLQCHLHRAKNLLNPRFKTRSERGCIGVGRDLSEAVSRAVASQCAWLAEDGMQIDDAYAMVSAAGKIVLGGVNRNYAVAASTI